MPIEVACGHCGALLKRKPYRLRRTPNQFCNHACLGKWISANYSGENSHFSKPKVEVKCAYCGAPKFLAPQRAAKPKMHFCDRRCQGAWMSEHNMGAGNPRWAQVEVECANCGKVLGRSPSKARRDQRNFCNPACKGEWMSEHNTGSSHPLYKGKRSGRRRYYGPNWVSQQRKARKRDGYKCRACGKRAKRGKRTLDVHHIKPFRDFGYLPEENDAYLQANDLSNLITLCQGCHKRAEHGKIPLQPCLL